MSGGVVYSKNLVTIKKLAYTCIALLHTFLDNVFLKLVCRNSLPNFFKVQSL